MRSDPRSRDSSKGMATPRSSSSRRVDRRSGGAARPSKEDGLTVQRLAPRDLLGLRLEPGQAGDPGLFGPGSVVWRVGRERVLLAGGPAALLLQLAHPLVAEGVAAHSGFEREPLQRLMATLDATLTITFGDRAQAEAAA